MRPVLLRYLHFIYSLSSYQTITLLLHSERLNLRFKPLLTTVYLSHLPSPTPSRNLSYNRFSKCIKNKGYFIFFLKRFEEEQHKVISEC